MGIPGPAPPPRERPPPLRFTAHLYERIEVERCFQTAALAGDPNAAVYWLLELCESGWVGCAWDQLWLAYYDFYAAHNPQFEGELLALSEMQNNKGRRTRYPILHGASALIGRKRSAGAWLIRNGALARNPRAVVHDVIFPAVTDDVIAALANSPQTAVDVLAPFAHASWEQLTPLYTAIVTAAEGDPDDIPPAWGRAGNSPIATVSALLLHLQLEHHDWMAGGELTLDLSPAEADRELVQEAARLVRRTRVTRARDRLLLWRQHPIPKAIGTLGLLPRHDLPRQSLREFMLKGDWLAATRGCVPWDRAIERCGGQRNPHSGRVVWPDEDAEERFLTLYDPDIDELPNDVVRCWGTAVPKGNKLRWLRETWQVKPQPDLWRELLVP